MAEVAKNPLAEILRMIVDRLRAKVPGRLTRFLPPLNPKRRHTCST
jgi:hypothetical protein